MPSLAVAPQVNMHEAKTNLSRIVADIEHGDVPFYVISRHGKPVAHITPLPPEPKKPHKRIGAAEGKLICPDDDFFYGDIDEETNQLIWESEIFPCD